MNNISSDQLLDQIFSITQSLYKEMSHSDNDIKNDHNEIFRLLTELGKKLVNADRASFWKWDKRTHEIWTTAAVGTGRITIPEGTGMVGKALTERRTLISNDPYNDPDFNSDVDKKTGYVTKSILCMPISNCKGEFIGAYQAINKLDNDGKFDLEEDTKRLSLAAFICGITLESEVFLEDSQHDKLTGLKNRMGFYGDFTRYNNVIHENKPVGLFISDIDFFKKVNDTYGHNAGDSVLRHAAGILSKNVPDGCGIYRWGGEEFIMVLPEKNKQETADVAEMIRQKIQESVCHYEYENPVPGHEFEDIRITMSFGVSEFRLDQPHTADEVIKTADENLYKAKEGGRNRVMI